MGRYVIGGYCGWTLCVDIEGEYACVIWILCFGVWYKLNEY